MRVYTLILLFVLLSSKLSFAQSEILPKWECDTEQNTQDFRTTESGQCPECDAFKKIENGKFDLEDLVNILNNDTPPTAEDEARVMNEFGDVYDSLESDIRLVELSLADEKYHLNLLDFCLGRENEVTDEIRKAAAQYLNSIPKMSATEAQQHLQNARDKSAQQIADYQNYINRKKDLKENGTAADKLKDALKQRNVDKDCGLSYAEYLALRAYMANFFKHINAFLRGQKSTLQGKPELAQSYLRVIRSGLRKIKPFQGTVYRLSEELPSAITKRFTPGSKIQFSSFLSTSAAKMVEHKDGQRGYGYGIWGSSKYNFIMTVKSGRWVAPLSGGGSEAEVLLPPLAKFQITKVESNTDGNKIIYMEEI